MPTCSRHGTPRKACTVSGSQEVPAVHLLGPGMAALVQAIPIAARATGRPVVVVGGLAGLKRVVGDGLSRE